MTDLAHNIRSESLEVLLGGLNTFERKNAPREVFAAGDTTLLNTPRVAIIGTREPSKKAIQRTRRICRELTKSEVTIVSGLARGIDTAAHRATIEAGGRTMPYSEPASTVSTRRKTEICRWRSCAAILQSRSSAPARRRDGRISPNAIARWRSFRMQRSSWKLERRAERFPRGWEAIRLGRPLFLMKSVVDNPDLKWPEEMIGYGAQVLKDVEELLLTVPPKIRADLHVDAATI